jgi:hypothetical protein
MSAWIIYIYVLISLVIAFTAFSAGWRAGLSAIGTSFFAFVAGAGLRGGLYGTTRQKVAGLGLARRAYEYRALDRTRFFSSRFWV